MQVNKSKVSFSDFAPLFLFSIAISGTKTNLLERGGIGSDIKLEKKERESVCLYTTRLYVPTCACCFLCFFSRLEFLNKVTC